MRSSNNTFSPNAFATGRNPKHAAVAATQGLLNLLDENEIEVISTDNDGNIDKETISLEELKQGGKFNLSIEVSNIGEYAGKEIVQLYIRDKVASIIRPIRELKGYKKVLIEKGKTARVEFELGKKELGFYNGEGEYLIEKGLFEVYVGENCLTENMVTFKIV